MFWTPDDESFMLHAEYFQKKPALFEKLILLPVLGRFYMRALWRVFDWKMPIFCPRSQFLAGSSHAAAIFSKSARYWPLIMRFLDSWLDGASAGYRVCVVYPKILGIKSNNCVYFKVVCQVVWWLEPDHMAKYSLPVLTDLTDIRKNQLFMC